MIKVRFDGSCPQNPGMVAAIGAVITREYCTLAKISKRIDNGQLLSNNVAEYEACAHALEFLVKEGLTMETIQLYGDSTVVINSLIRGTPSKGICAPNSKRTLALSKQFSDLRPYWIPRKENGLADKLSKLHYSKKLKKTLFQKRSPKNVSYYETRMSKDTLYEFIKNGRSPFTTKLSDHA